MNHKVFIGLLAKAPKLRSHSCTPTFSVAQIRKDLGVMFDVALPAGVVLPIATHTVAASIEAEQVGSGLCGHAVVVRNAERRTGLALSSTTDP